MRAAFAASRKRGGLGNIPPREIHSLEFDKQSPQDMSSVLKSCEVSRKSLRISWNPSRACCRRLCSVGRERPISLSCRTSHQETQSRDPEMAETGHGFGSLNESLGQEIEASLSVYVGDMCEAPRVDTLTIPRAVRW